MGENRISMGMTLVVGIDPGLNGYSALLERHTVPARIQSFFPARTLMAGAGKGERRIYDLLSMSRDAALWRASGVELVVIEKQQAFPKQGSVSNFTTGYGYGAWLAILTTVGLSFHVVGSQRWKKDLGVAGGGPVVMKRRSIETCQNLFSGLDLRPHEVKPGARVASHDKAEAVLLAWYGATRVLASPATVAKGSDS